MSRMKKTLYLLPLFTLLSIILYTNSILASTSLSVRDEVIEKANEYLGVPYLYGGTTPKAFDCSGFLFYVFDHVGTKLPRTTIEQYKVGTPIDKSELQKGDLVFFQTYRSGPSHSGIYVGDGNFIHASTSKGISIASLDDPYYWSPRYLGARRIIEEEPKVYSLLPKGEFHDVGQEHWAYSEINFLTVNGISNGFENSFYNPGDTVTRASAAIMLTNALGLNTTKSSTSFTDISNEHWGFNAIHAVTEAGFFSGYSDGSFKPNDPLTRAQVAAIFTKAFQLSGAEKISFTDVSPNHWAYSSIHALASSGITSGYTDGTYKPNEEVTRASFSVMLYRGLHIK